MRRFIAVIAAICISGLGLSMSPLASHVSGAGPDPVTCTGYAEARAFFEAQSWWTQAEGEADQHLHMGMCFPLNQTVSNTLSLDVRLLKHGALGRSTTLRIHDDFDKECHRSHPEVAADEPDTTTFVHVELDTRCFPDGFRKLALIWRVRQSNGNDFIVRQMLPVDIENGKADVNWRPQNHLLGGGQVKEPARDWHYASSLVLGRTGEKSAYSLAPRSGTFALHVQGGPAPPAGITQLSFVATLDPDFHNGNTGTEVLREAGGYKGPLSINTTTLGNGPHKLVLIECHELAVEHKTLCGVQVVPFTVAN